MDLIGPEQGRLDRLAAWLRATPAELAALALLLAGCLAVTGVLWLRTAPSPATPEPLGPAAADATVGADATPDRTPVASDPAGGSGAPGRDEGAMQRDEGTAGAAEQERLTVHVSGAVASPGLVTVDADARVADALAAAGEATDEADLSALNLAAPVSDGERVHVPVPGEAPPALDGDDDAGAPVDLNRADAAALEALPGIGPAKAAAIVEHRERHGPFETPGGLREVSGIGEATFQGLADRVTVR